MQIQRHSWGDKHCQGTSQHRYFYKQVCPSFSSLSKMFAVGEIQMEASLKHLELNSYKHKPSLASPAPETGSTFPGRSDCAINYQHSCDYMIAWPSLFMFVKSNFGSFQRAFFKHLVKVPLCYKTYCPDFQDQLSFTYYATAPAERLCPKQAGIHQQQFSQAGEQYQFTKIILKSP